MQLIWGGCLKCKGMQFGPHATAQRGVDDLMLANSGNAAKSLTDHGRRVVVTIACQVLYRYTSIRQRRLDQGLDFTCRHRHLGGSPA